MADTVPSRVSVAVPDPPAVTPPPDAADSVPDPTASVTRTTPEAASMSEMESPVRPSAVSSVVVKVAGNVPAGASLAAVMVTVVLPLAVNAPPVPCAPELPSLKVQPITTEAGGVSDALA